MGLICGVGNTSLKSGRTFWPARAAWRRITHFDATNFACQIAAEVKGFDPLNFIEKKEIKKMGRFIHFAMAATEEAMKMAGL